MEGSRMLREGALVGLIGASCVALWFLLYDVAAGLPFRTPALLGAVLFHGLRDPAALAVTPGLVLEYTVFHGLAFLLFGVIAAGLFALVDADRHVVFAIFMLFCCFVVATLVTVRILASWLFDTIAPWLILGANLLAALVMLTVLVRRHHRSFREVLTSAE